MLHLTEDAIRRAVGERAFRAGREYEAEERVSNLRLLADGRVVEARVRGGASRPYRVRATLLDMPGRTAVSGSCSCPVGMNCKHVAAALLAAMALPAASAGAQAGAQAGPQAAPAAPALPPETDAWLGALERAQQDETEAFPPTVRKRLLYVVKPISAPGGPDRVQVELVGIELRADGSMSDKVKPYGPYHFQYGSPPRFLRPSDRAILRRLPALSHGGSGDAPAGLLREIIATGRGRWLRVDGPALREGEPRPGRFAWRLGRDGAQRLALEADGLTPLLVGDPWYTDGHGLLGPLDLPLPSALVRLLLSGPPVRPEAAARLGAELARRLPGLPLPPPRHVEPPRPVGGKPVPCLELFGLGAESGRDPALDPLPAARVSFRYGAVRVPPGRAAPAAAARQDTVQQDGVLYAVTRDRAAEAAAGTALAELGLRPRLPSYAFAVSHAPGNAESDVLVFDDPAEWIGFVAEDVPALRQDGWDVDVRDSFPVRLARLDGDIEADVREGSGIDWFDLELGAMVDGQRVDLVPALLDLAADPDALAALRDDAQDAPPLLLPLPDGRLLVVPFERVRPILAPLLELFAGGTVEDGRLRLPRAAAADLAALEEAPGLAWAGGEGLRALGRMLRDAGGIPQARVPDGFAASLRPYQARGVDWLQLLRAAGFGGVLADDMGLGKTVQALAHLAIEQAEGRLDRPALVVCPTSVVPNWRAEAARFAPSLRVLTLHGPDRAERFGQIGAHDLALTTYPLLARDHEVLLAQDWHVVLLDEAQTIKNPAATASKLARSLRARQRLCLSGTPLENHLGELWSLFDFVLPGFLGDRGGFQRRYRTPIERGGDAERQALLARRVAPFMLRRTKEEVAAELPPKTEIAETVEMGDAQRAVYESIRLAMHARVRRAIEERGLARSGIVILDALLKLRQACCDPRLLKLGTVKAARARSAKLERLMEMLPALVEEGRRVLVFSQFTSMLALIEAELSACSLPYALLTGDTADRTAPVRRFQAGEVPLFLVSLKAGGVGLNLTAADTVIHYDPWWNPAVEDQATDRAHRIGQDKPVFVHRLIASGTIEEKMEALKARKQALVAGILGEARGGALRMTQEDVDALFEPAA